MITIKDAKFLANELILGTDIKSRATETVRATYAAFVSGDAKAEKVLVTLWEVCATDKPTLAVIRSIFNRVTKKMHKELGIEKRAMVVKDGKLVEAQQRGAKGDGGGEGEGGEVETLGLVAEHAETVDTDELKAAWRTLAAHADTVTDPEVFDALNIALDMLNAI